MNIYVCFIKIEYREIEIGYSSGIWILMNYLSLSLSKQIKIILKVISSHISMQNWITAIEAGRAEWMEGNPALLNLMNMNMLSDTDLETLYFLQTILPCTPKWEK